MVFWSPDGRFVGYYDGDGRLWSVQASGGTPQFIGDVPETRQLMSAVWRRDGSIALAVWRGNLYTVPASGGQPISMLTIDRTKEVDVHEMAELPDGRLILAIHLNAPEPAASIRVEIVGSSSRETAFDAPLLPMAPPANNRLLMLRSDVNPGSGRSITPALCR